MESPNAKESKRIPFRDLMHKRRFLKPIAGLVLGAAAGFLYFHYTGCSSGSCAITGNPYMSTLFGAALGFYALNSPCSRC